MGLFPAANEDRQMKFSVMIPMTYAHLVYTLFCPSVCHLCFKGQTDLFFKGFTIFIIFLHNLSFFYLYVCPFYGFLCSTTCKYCHSYKMNMYLILIANARKIATITRNIPIRNPVLEPTHSLNLEHISKRFFFTLVKQTFSCFNLKTNNYIITSIENKNSSKLKIQ